MPIITLRSYLAPNLFPFYAAIGAAIGRALGVTAIVDVARLDPLDDADLQNGRCDIAFLCGLPFVRLEHDRPGHLFPLAAPVPQGTAKAPRHAAALAAGARHAGSM